MKSKKTTHKKKLKKLSKKLQQAQRREKARQLPTGHGTSPQQPAVDLLYRPRPHRKLSFPVTHHPMIVTRVKPLSATLMSIVLTPADDANSVPLSRDLVEEYIRVILPAEDQPVEPAWKTGSRGPVPVWGKPSPASRKYTIRRYWPENGALEINVALHAAGPGTHWARAVTPGDRVWIQGAKSGLSISYDYDFYFLILDETGLGGALRWIEQLPATARGEILVQASASDSAFTFRAPPGFSTTWYQPDQDGTPSPLIEALLEREAPVGHTFAFIVGESTLVRHARTVAREEWNLDQADSFTHGYWKNKQDPAHAVAQAQVLGNFTRWTKAELYQHAQRISLPYRSQMTKDDLILALRKRAQTD